MLCRRASLHLGPVAVAALGSLAGLRLVCYIIIIFGMVNVDTLLLECLDHIL